MSRTTENFLRNRQLWQAMYDQLLHIASTGVLEAEILEAKKAFYSHLGRSHEMSEELYESATLSFLEWYLWEYPTKRFGKPPAVVVATMGKFPEEFRDILLASLFQRWSLFRVAKVEPDSLVLEDLLFAKQRRKLMSIYRNILVDKESAEAKLWNLKEDQVIQARLFPFHQDSASALFMTHLWIHPEAERDNLRKLCVKRRKLWGLHHDFLLSTFEAVIRSYGIQKQIQVSQTSNWMYQEIYKRYSKAA